MPTTNAIARDYDGGYWGDHPGYPATDWQHEVANGDTRRGYWSWVHAKREEDDCDD